MYRRIVLLKNVAGIAQQFLTQYPIIVLLYNVYCLRTRPKVNQAWRIPGLKQRGPGKLSQRPCQY